MWWLWIALIVYLVVGIGISIWILVLDDDEDGGFFEFIGCTLIMPIPVAIFVIYESIEWIYNKN